MTHPSGSQTSGDGVRTGAQATQLEITMESALSPREIQARIRAGDALEDVARAAGMPTDWVEPFAAPVLAEREYIAGLARNHQARRGGETIPHRSLVQVVDDRLASRGVDTETLSWDAWRLEGRRWLVRLTYDSGKSRREADFVYDANGRFSVADNDDARWLLGLHSASHGPQPGRRRREEEAEPTVDLNDDLALVRVVQPRIEEAGDDLSPLGETDDAYAEAELAEVDGVYDILPTQTGGLDVLYDMLSSFDEDSVQIYAGLIREQQPEPPRHVTPDAPAAAVPKRSRQAPTPPATPIEPEPIQPSIEEVIEEAPIDRPRKGRKRAEVPSWDEIMFGSPKNRS